LPANKYGDIYLQVAAKKQPDAKNKSTHYVAVDEYSYNRDAQQVSQQPQQYQQPQQQARQPIQEDDLPF
jgi:hypothetical protein